LHIATVTKFRSKSTVKNGWKKGLSSNFYTYKCWRNACRNSYIFLSIRINSHFRVCSRVKEQNPTNQCQSWICLRTYQRRNRCKLLTHVKVLVLHLCFSN